MNMKKTITCATCLAAIALLATVSCKEKKQSDDIIIAKYVPETPQAPIKLPVDHRNTQVDWLGKNYEVDITRHAADSLPMLTDESGQKYVDNIIKLQVKRSDKSVFINKSFTKSSFAMYLNEDMRKSGYLENIVLHGIKDDALFFGVVISHPGAEDEFVPLEMLIDRLGGLVVKQGELFDMNI